MILPALTQQPKWGGDSLQIDNLGVLEGGCESDHTRHVLAEAGEVVIFQAVSKWARVSTLSGFRSVILPFILLDRPTYQARIRHAAAYLTVESCGIFAIASAMCFTPSGPMSFLAILQATRVAVAQVQMRDSAQYHTCSEAGART